MCFRHFRIANLVGVFVMAGCRVGSTVPASDGLTSVSKESKDARSDGAPSGTAGGDAGPKEVRSPAAAPTPIEAADALFAEGKYREANRAYLKILTSKQLVGPEEVASAGYVRAWLGNVKCTAITQGDPQANLAFFVAKDIYPPGTCSAFDEALPDLQAWMKSRGFQEVADQIAGEISRRPRQK